MYVASMSTPRHASSPNSPEAPALKVVIAGGGVAALETVLALRKLAGDAVAIELVSPAAQFVYRPMAVLEPFVGSPPRELDLSEFAQEIGADLQLGWITAVDGERQVAQTADGLELRYDALVIAAGARRLDPPTGVVAIDVGNVAASMREITDAIDAGAISSLAFLLTSPSWPLPAYEIALLTHQRAEARGLDLEVSIVTDEPRPLDVFGDAVSEAAGRLLEQAGVSFVSAADASLADGEVVFDSGRRRLRFDRVAALPRLAGPRISGLPHDEGGFLPVGAHGEITGLKGVYAAGDATDFPVKFGAIATHQADAVATAIAASAGADVAPEPFAGVVDGILLAGSGRERVYFSAVFEDGRATSSTTAERPTGGVEAKIAGRYLGPYLDDRWAAGPRWLAEQLSWETTLTRLEEQFAG